MKITTLIVRPLRQEVSDARHLGGVIRMIDAQVSPTRCYDANHQLASISKEMGQTFHLNVCCHGISQIPFELAKNPCLAHKKKLERAKNCYIIAPNFLRGRYVCVAREKKGKPSIPILNPLRFGGRPQKSGPLR